MKLIDGEYLEAAITRHISQAEADYREDRLNHPDIEDNFMRGYIAALKHMKTLAYTQTAVKAPAEGEWTLVSKELPAHADRVLVSCYDDEGDFVQVADFYFNGAGKAVFMTELEYDEVVAWQPLMKPYPYAEELYADEDEYEDEE